MSSLRKQGKIWHLAWYCAPGCKKHPRTSGVHWRSLDTKDRKTAESLQREKDAELANDKARARLGLHRKAPERDLTLREFVTAYFADQEAVQTKRPTTLETERQVLEHLLRFAGEKARLSGLTDELLRRYHAHMRKTLAEATVFNRRRILRAIFSAPPARQWIPENPIDAMPRLTLTKRAPKLVSREAIERARTAAPPFLSAVVGFLYLSGCRVGELCKLEKRDVHRREGFLRFRDPKEKQDKEVFLTPDLLACLAAGSHPASEYAFSETGQQLTRHAVYQKIRDLGATLHVHLNPHRFRHARPTHLLEDGVDILTVQGLMGHRQMSTTAGYAHPSLEQQRRSQERLSLKTALARKENASTSIRKTRQTRASR